MPAMTFNPVTPEVIDKLRAAVGDDGLVTDPETLKPFASDYTEDLVFMPEVAVLPRTAEQIQALMRIASEHRIPVTPRAGGTGLSGGALPVLGGILLSCHRMNQILEVDRENLIGVVEPGVITQVFQEEVEKVGLFYPPDPASRGSCTLGGNVAENAGGPRAVKYGVTKDFVMGLEAVLPDGRLIETGGKLYKDVSGYNLTQLLVGSEGTLAIITKIALKLIPWPAHRKVLLAPFASLDDAARAVVAVFGKGVQPSACELMERDAVQCASSERSGLTRKRAPICCWRPTVTAPNGLTRKRCSWVRPAWRLARKTFFWRRTNAACGRSGRCAAPSAKR
jgi:glycolate oxidase